MDDSQLNDHGVSKMDSIFDNDISESKTFKYVKSKSSINEFNNNKINDNSRSDVAKRRKTKGSQMLKTFKKKKKKSKIQRTSLAALASKEKDQMSKEVRSIFKTDSLMSNNIKSLQKEKKINDTIVAIISFVLIILCFYQLYLLIDENYYESDKILTVRTCILVLRYNIDLDIRKYNLKLKETSFLTSGLIKSFMVEILFNIIQPFPYLDYTFQFSNGLIDVTCSLSHLSTILMVLRLYLIFKLLNHYNMWTNARSKRICNLLGFEPTSTYATKVMLESSPVFLLSLLSLLFIIILGLLIRGFEFYNINQKDQDFANLWNALWLNFVTMSTVGYGDYTPQTNFGKIFCIISCLFGIFLLSMFVAVITLLILLDTDEYRAFQKLSEKEVIFNKMKKEITELFDIVGIMYKYKKSVSDEDKNQDEVDLQRLLVKIRTHQLNERKRLLGIHEDSTELLLKEFEKHLDFDMTECVDNTIKIVQCEKKFYFIANKQVEIEKMSITSKYLANRISNLSNLMRILGTCGKLERIDDLEGGRLYNWRSLTCNYKRYFSTLKYDKRVKLARMSRKSNVKLKPTKTSYL